MCLDNDPGLVKEWLITHSGQEKVRAWKIVDVRWWWSRWKLTAPYGYGLFFGYRYYAGCNKSNSKQTEPSTVGYQEINHGIHVFLDYYDAKGLRNYQFSSRGIVIPVWVKPDELLGVGIYDAAFKNMYIDQDVYDEATTKGREYEHVFEE